MVFPMMSPPPQPPSPRAQELGQRVALTIAEFHQKYPDLSSEEVRQALELAADRSSERARPAAASVVGVVVAAAAAVGLGAYLVRDKLPLPHGAAALPAIVAALIAVLVAVVARRRRE